jgi:hypothetical protein
MLDGPEKDPVSFTPNVTHAINTIPFFMQHNIAQCLPIVQKVALGTTVK